MQKVIVVGHGTGLSLSRFRPYGLGTRRSLLGSYQDHGSFDYRNSVVVRNWPPILHQDFDVHLGRVLYILKSFLSRLSGRCTTGKGGNYGTPASVRILF